MDSASCDFNGPVRGPRFSQRHVSSVADMSAKARDFSDLSNPDVVKRLCLEKIDCWSIHDIPLTDMSVDQIMAGLTNQLFVVSLTNNVWSQIHPQKVLFRVYGSTVGDLYDTAAELKVFKLLAQYKAAPLLIGEFSGGRIEQYLDGPPLLAEELSNPSIVTAMANILARFHQVHTVIDEMKSWQHAPSLWTSLTKWARKSKKLAEIAAAAAAEEEDNHRRLEAAPAAVEKPVRNSSITSTEELFTSKAFLMSVAEKKSLLASINDTGIHQMLDEIPILKDLCLNDPQIDPAHPLLTIAFCHNDVQPNNILCTGSRLRLIDFEYASFNYPAFDIANFFCEMTIDYMVEEPPCFAHENDPEKFPSESLVRLFGSVYMSALTGDSYLPDDARLDVFVKIIHRFVLASHLLWGFWSIIRAPQAATQNDFDYLMYAQSRFDAYTKWKRLVVAAPSAAAAPLAPGL